MAVQGSETGAPFDAWMFGTSGTSVRFDGEWRDVVRHSFLRYLLLPGDTDEVKPTALHFFVGRSRLQNLVLLAAPVPQEAVETMTQEGIFTPTGTRTRCILGRRSVSGTGGPKEMDIRRPYVVPWPG